MRSPHRGRRSEAGQGTLEYVGMALLAALLTAAVVLGTGNGSTITGAFERAICTVTGGGDCGEDGTTDGGDQDGGDQDGEDNPDNQDPGDDTEDPTEDVDIPEGLDPDSEIVQILLSTERGRETLQWLADHDVPIVIDPDETGAYWNGSEIVLGEGNADAATLVHEANHAKYDDEGRSADASELGRDEYVTAAINEETDGLVQQILAAQEFRDEGHDVPTQPAENVFWDAYNDAIDGGASPAEAEAAGTDAVNGEFYNGGLVASTNGQSYPDLYGGYWDAEN